MSRSILLKTRHTNKGRHNLSRLKRANLQILMGLRCQIGELEGPSRRSEAK